MNGIIIGTVGLFFCFIIFSFCKYLEKRNSIAREQWLSTMFFLIMLCIVVIVVPYSNQIFEFE